MRYCLYIKYKIIKKVKKEIVNFSFGIHLIEKSVSRAMSQVFPVGQLRTKNKKTPRNYCYCFYEDL